eukprot:scaffold897_cov402-Prasinococcus_capsulatus_cf.AAC.70
MANLMGRHGESGSSTYLPALPEPQYERPEPGERLEADRWGTLTKSAGAGKYGVVRCPPGRLSGMRPGLVHDAMYMQSICTAGAQEGCIMRQSSSSSSTRRAGRYCRRISSPSDDISWRPHISPKTAAALEQSLAKEALALKGGKPQLE